MDQPTQPGFYFYTCDDVTTVADVYQYANALISRTGCNFGNGPVDRIPGKWEPLVDPDVLAAAERRIQELEDDNRRLLSELEQAANVARAVGSMNQSLKDALDHNGQKHDAMRSQLEALRTPCQCDPPGSGEEFCNSTCMIRDTLARLMNESGRVSHGNTNVMEMFDAAVAQVRGEKTIDG